MNRALKTLFGATLLTVAAGGAFAQTYTRATLAAGNPFDGLGITPATFVVTDASLAALGPAELADLNARCDLIVSWPSFYGWGTAAFCQDILVVQGLMDAPTFTESSAVDTTPSPNETTSSDSSSASSSSSE